MEQRKALGELKAQIAAEETALDEKGISDSDKKAHKKHRGSREAVDKIEKKARSSRRVLRRSRSARRRPPTFVTGFGFGPRQPPQAVDDAKIAKAPLPSVTRMAATSLLDSAKQMASVYTADVVEEKTGSAQSRAPAGVTMEAKVAIS